MDKFLDRAGIDVVKIEESPRSPKKLIVSLDAGPLDEGPAKKALADAGLTKVTEVTDSGRFIEEVVKHSN